MTLLRLAVASLAFAAVSAPSISTAPATAPTPSAPAPAPAAQPPQPTLIQIGIVPRTDQLDIVAEGSYGVVDLDGHKHPLQEDRTYTFLADDRALSLEDWLLPQVVRLAPTEDWADIKIGQRRYHGTLIIRANSDGTVTAIEELPIEDYLLGVLPLEMDPQWPLEALKAQAVVARTFAYTQLDKYRKAGFDLTNDTRSQVYGGWSDDPPASVKKAVRETRGEVLGYKGKLLDVYYHSCCGGHTADEGSVWHLYGPTPRPLRGVRDRYCRRAPNYRWKAVIGYDRVLAALQRRRMVGGALRSLSVGSRARSGWVQTFVARVGDKTLRVSANDFRLAVGASLLKSARILRVRLTRRGVEFTGAGSGHGVGLCQWGAREQAVLGRRYERILEYYFPGSTLSVIEE